MPDLAACRRTYAEMVCALAGSRDPKLLEAFATIPREEFLGPGPWKILRFSRDYMDTPSDDPVYLCHDKIVAIDAARGLNNGQPSFLAFLIDAMALTPGARAVHVGAGVGYYTAIMAELVGPAGKVVGYEVDKALAARSRKNLARYPQVACRAGSGIDLEERNLDALYINAGATHPLPVWLDALAPGGRLILPMTGNRFGIVMKFTKPDVPDDRCFAAAFLSGVAIYHCDGARDPRAAKALDRAIAKRGHKDVASLRRDRHRRGDTCWLHGRGWCLSTEPQ